MANAIPVRYEHCTWTQWVVSAHYIQRDGQRQLRPRAVNRSRQRSSKHNHMLLDYTCRTVATKERSLKHRIWILIGLNFLSILGLPWWLSDKESVCQCRRHRRLRLDSWVKNILGRRKWQCIPVFLPEKSHEQRAWQATVHEVEKSKTQLSDWTRKPADSYIDPLALFSVAAIIETACLPWFPV